MWPLPQYNVVVYGSADDSIFKNSSGRSYFPMDRLFEYTEPKLRSRYQDDLASLGELPTLFLGETHNGVGTPAFLSSIDEIEQRGGQVHFRFEHLCDRLTSEEVFNCGYFDITIRRAGLDERSRTHWAVKEGNLIQGLFNLLQAQPEYGCPRLFNVEQWPLPVLGHIAVMMPFDKKFDPVYEAIRSACTSQGFKTLRVDEIYGPTKIMDDVFSAIVQSRLVISDLTDRNPNLLYETGLAHALDRKVIVIVQNIHDIPFDLNQIRHVPYLPNKEGLDNPKEGLSASIQASRIQG